MGTLCNIVRPSDRGFRLIIERRISHDDDEKRFQRLTVLFSCRSALHPPLPARSNHFRSDLIMRNYFGTHCYSTSEVGRWVPTTPPHNMISQLAPINLLIENQLSTFTTTASEQVRLPGANWFTICLPLLHSYLI